MRTLRALLPAILAALLLVLAAHAGARAQSLGDTIAPFAENSFPKTEAAIVALTASGDPRSQAVIEALRDGNLVVDPADKHLYIKSAAGVIDAATGEPVAAPPEGLKPVRLNNKIRGAINGALGALTLLAPDAGKRMAAAKAVFASRDATALPALEAALAKETNAAIKRAMEDARAALLVSQPGMAEADQIAAVATIRAHGGQEALALLTLVPADAPPAVRSAADAAIGVIEGELAVWSLAQNAWYGLSLGSVLLLAAIGLAITFGVMGVINMAHGEMVMLGAYTTFVVQDNIRDHAPWLFDW